MANCHLQIHLQLSIVKLTLSNINLPPSGRSTLIDGKLALIGDTFYKQVKIA